MRQGVYSELRYAMAALKADRNHLDNAPLGPTQRKRLQERVDGREQRVAELRREIRANGRATAPCKKW